MPLQLVVSRRALDDEVSRMGLSVGDEQISSQILANPSFRGLDGTFDRDQYRSALARSGVSVNEFEETLREDAARSLVQGAVFAGIPLPEVYAETLAGFSREERSFTWATLTADDFEIEIGTPSEEELQAHYDANPALYTSREIRVIDYAWLTADMIQDEVTVDEAELRAEYDARIQEFQQPERRLVERLVFSDAEAAQAALAQIEAGETGFPDLVEERGLSLSDIDLGDVTQEDLDAAGAAVFAAETGDVVGPFETDLGPALFRMNAILAARNISFEEAVPELREDEAAARAGRIIEDQIDPISNLLAGGASIADLAEQTDMQAGTLEWIDGDAMDIAAYAAFRDAAAAANVGDYPELLQLEDGGLFALEVTEIRAPALIPLEEIREDVIAGWTEEARAAAVVTEAQARAEQLREGSTDFAALELDSVQENGLTRRAFVNGTPPNFVTEVFAMETGDIRVIENGNSAVIVRLDAISAADDSDAAFTAEVASIGESAANGIAQDIYEIYARSVQVNADVSINQAAVNAVHANFR